MAKQTPIPPSPPRRSRIAECVNGPIFVIAIFLAAIAFCAWLAWGCV